MGRKGFTDPLEETVPSLLAYAADGHNLNPSNSEIHSLECVAHSERCTFTWVNHLYNGNKRSHFVMIKCLCNMCSRDKIQQKLVIYVIYFHFHTVIDRFLLLSVSIPTLLKNYW